MNIRRLIPVYWLITAGLFTVAMVRLVAYTPDEATMGPIQKIFYLHVPLAIVALGGFVVGGIHAIRHLRTGDPKHDARSSCPVVVPVARFVPSRSRRSRPAAAVESAPLRLPSAIASATRALPTWLA